MFENVDGRTDDGRRTTDAGVTGILIAHLGAFGSGELINIYSPVSHTKILAFFLPLCGNTTSSSNAKSDPSDNLW